MRLAGIDEAGRGPLAGPVVAAAVVFDPSYLLAGRDPVLGKLTDSKAMPAALREECYAILAGSASAAIGTGIIGVGEIDRTNILVATHRAMAAAALEVSAQHALVDGLPVKGLPCGSRSIVKGDALSLSISAASVVAKVVRDRIMLDLDERYPGYGFAKHKGYGTREHLAALRRLGPCPAHRRTFRPVAALNQLDLL